MSDMSPILSIATTDPAVTAGIASWPIAHRDLQAGIDRIQGGYLNRLSDLPAETRAVWILAGHSFISYASWITELGLLAANTRSATATAPVLRFLAGETDDMPTAEFGAARFGAAVPPNFALLRRARRMVDWRSPPAAIVGAILPPPLVATGHNHLLLDWLKRQRPAAGYRHAESYLAAARPGDPADVRPAATEQAHAAAALIVDAAGFEGGLANRVCGLLTSTGQAVFARAQADLAALSRLRNLPQTMWAATGGNWASRALGLEVLRRGGTVHRFGHGGKDAFIAETDMLTMIEASCASHFVAFTGAAADLLREQGLAKRLQPWKGLEVSHADGNPIYGASLAARAGAVRGKPRLLYVKAIFRGLRQLAPPLLPDAVYLNWQQRLAAALDNLPVEALAKPHPEGLFRGRLDPIEALMRVTYDRFEQRLAWADVFLFDCGDSTTFYEALCTDKPIIYLDLGLTRFTDAARRMLERRCRVITVRYDDCNLPALPVHELRSALENLFPADPTEFRHILMGSRINALQG
jgi:hypothetical protein